MEPKQELKDFISMAVCGLCDFPKEVAATISELNSTNVFVLITVQRDDIKRVIGSKGKNIDALRTICDAISAKHKIKTIIRIDE